MSWCMVLPPMGDQRAVLATLFHHTPRLQMVCFCMLLLGCSEPKEESLAVLNCKIVARQVAFDRDDMIYVKVKEWEHDQGPRVEIEFDDYNEHGAKNRRRVSCEFDQKVRITEVWIDRRPLIFEQMDEEKAKTFLAKLNAKVDAVRQSQ
jgi:hypothetical protein